MNSLEKKESESVIRCQYGEIRRDATQADKQFLVLGRKYTPYICFCRIGIYHSVIHYGHPSALKNLRRVYGSGNYGVSSLVSVVVPLLTKKTKFSLNYMQFNQEEAKDREPVYMGNNVTLTY